MATATATAQGTEHMGETKGAQNHDHDLIQDLSKRLDALWRYDQYIANADGKPKLQECWRMLQEAGAGERPEAQTTDRRGGQAGLLLITHRARRAPVPGGRMWWTRLFSGPERHADDRSVGVDRRQISPPLRYEEEDS